MKSNYIFIMKNSRQRRTQSITNITSTTKISTTSITLNCTTKLSITSIISTTRMHITITDLQLIW